MRPWNQASLRLPLCPSLSVLSVLSVPSVLASCLLLGISPAIAQDWVEFTEETSTRLVADAAVGSADSEEKDYAFADLDRDGDIDLLVARKTPFTNVGPRPNVLLRNEDGVLTDRTAALAPDFLDSTDDRDIVIVDVDGDGWLDVITATTLGEQPRLYKNLGEDPGGSWLGIDWDETEGRLPTFDPAPQFCAIAVGDLTGDGRPEIYFADYDNNLEDRLLINDGNGFFTDETSTRLAPGMADSVFGTDAEIADMNGDGFLDIVKNNSSGSSPPPGSPGPNTAIFYNDGTGHFAVRDEVYSDAPYMTQVGDFNKDGRTDIFVVDDGQDATLWNTGNNGSGEAVFNTVVVSGSPDTTFFGGNTAAADLDLDGIPDIAVADVDTDIPGCGGELVVLRGTGTPPNIVHTDPINGAPRPWRQQGTFDVAIFDIDGDLVPDLFIGHCTGTKIFMGESELANFLFVDGFETADLTQWSSATP